MDKTALTHRARYLFPVSGPMITGGTISIAEGRITSVKDVPGAQPTSVDVDWQDAIIIPGLVNAHTHLEFSSLRSPIGNPGMPFCDWIAQVISHRSSEAADPRAAIRSGLSESIATGTTTLGEIATGDWPAQAKSDPDVSVTLFRELIGSSPEVANKSFQTARDYLDRTPAQNVRCRVGMSPHAPYSVRRELLGKVVEYSRERQFPVAMHLAESTEELQLLGDGSGPFRTLLEQLGVWRADAMSTPCRALDYLQILARAHRALIIHGNYLAPDELEFVGNHSNRMSLVFCPRTHAYFGHPPYPLHAAIGAGINVALGTDSRASNPDLDMLAEMKRVANDYEDVRPVQVLKMGTQAGALALGLEAETGSLEPGKWADFVVVRLPKATGGDPIDLLLHDESRVIATVCRGRMAYGAGTS